MIINDSIELLGKKAKDKITGAIGIITSICFDLYGCIQVIISPQKINEKGEEIKPIGWIDINRIKIINNTRIMNYPDFDNKYTKIDKVNGAATKPLK
jgi:hypothetical protein